MFILSYLTTINYKKEAIMNKNIYKKIMMAIDIENENLEKFLKQAVSICELLNPEETYIVYINSPLAGTPSMVAGSIHEKKEDVLDLKLKVNKIIPEEIFHKFNTSYIVKSGDTSKIIVELVENLKIDLLFLGKKLRTGLESIFHLKVEHKVLKDVKCDVFLIDLTVD